MMNELIYTFEREASDCDWRCHDEEAGLCSGGLGQYVEIPEGVKEFEAIFSQEEPIAGDYFTVEEGGEYGYRLDTDDGVEFYEVTANLLGQAYREGYIFLRVRY